MAYNSKFVGLHEFDLWGAKAVWFVGYVWCSTSTAEGDGFWGYHGKSTGYMFVSKKPAM